MSAILSYLKYPLLFLGLVIFFLLSLIGYWNLRGNQAQVHPDLKMDNWVAAGDGLHNSNTDLIRWRDQLYLAHAASPYHMGTTDCKIVVKRSKDGKKWEKVAEFQWPDQDIRDPKFAVIGDKLFVYALPNAGFYAIPNTTVYSATEDGKKWSEMKKVVGADGWLFWRPRTTDGETWYVSAYWKEHGKAHLFKSTDGVKWEEVGKILHGGGLDETAILFLSDGRLLTTVRVENEADSMSGDNQGGTSIGVAEAPFTEWSHEFTNLTRLDGPCLFKVNGKVYALGRYQPEKDGLLFQSGGALSRKRTALFAVDGQKLIYLTDFPSGGDTAYGGVVIHDDHVYLTYYTSRTDRDLPWVMGMISPSNIRMAKISVANLEKIRANPLTPQSYAPTGTYVVVALNILFWVALFIWWYRRTSGGTETPRKIDPFNDTII